MNQALHDNGSLIAQLMKSKKMHFVVEYHKNTAYYFARNRAAKRYIRSTRFKNMAKENRIEIQLDNNAVA